MKTFYYSNKIKRLKEKLNASKSDREVVFSDGNSVVDIKYLNFKSMSIPYANAFMFNGFFTIPKLSDKIMGGALI